jgi:hypothetical protein
VSAIRKFLDVCRIIADTGYPGAKGWLEQIDAAEAELKALERTASDWEGLAYDFDVVRNRLFKRLVERDRADAELLAAWEHISAYGRHLKAGEWNAFFLVAERWAADCPDKGWLK